MRAARHGRPAPRGAAGEEGARPHRVALDRGRGRRPVREAVPGRGAPGTRRSRPERAAGTRAAAGPDPEHLDAEPLAPRRVHLPRPVHRSRHHVRSDVEARSRQRPGRAAQLPHPALRPRLALRRRSARSAVPVRLGRRLGARPQDAARPEAPGRPQHGGGDTVDDLPRNDQNRALVGDPRNDENIIVSQLQLLFIHFHNKVVDRLLDSRPDASARRRVGPGAANGAMALPVDRRTRLPAQGRRQGHGAIGASPRRRKGAAPTVHRKFYDWKDTPYMPVEFSGAAYRFGHSMVRPNYVMRDMDRPVSVFGPARRAMRHAPSQDLSGRRAPAPRT